MITTKPATEKDLTAAVKLSEDVFKSSFLKDLTLRESGFKPSNIRLLYDDGVLASCVCVLPRNMLLDGKVIPLAGIGGVATHPDYRGKGYANKLMTDAVEYMKKEGYGLSVLYPFKEEYYRQFGYSTVRLPYRIIKADRSMKTGRRYQVREIGGKEIVEMENIYNEFNAGGSGMIQRDKRYWTLYLEYRKADTRIFGAFKSGSLKGFAMTGPVYKNRGEQACGYKLSEFNCLNTYEDTGNVLSLKAINEASMAGFKEAFYDDSSGNRIIHGKPATAKQMERYINLKYVKMYSLINLNTILSKMDDVFNRRLRLANKKGRWQDCISFKREAGGVSIEIKKSGKITLIQDKKFISMLLGAGIKNSAPVLQLLFPPLKPVFYDFDYL